MDGDAPDALRRGEERLRLIQRAAGIGALEWHLRTDRIWRSEEYCRILGLDSALAGDGTADPLWWQRLHPDDRDDTLAWHRQVIATVGPFEREYRIVRPDGRIRWVSRRGEVTAGDDGRPERLLLVLIDITEQRAEAGRAAAQAQELAAIYAAAPVALCVLDRDLRYVRINDRMAQINGAPAAAHIGRHVSEMVPDLIGQTEAAFRRVLAGEVLQGIEITGTTPGRQDRVSTWRGHWVPLRDTAGAITGIIISAEDVTAERASRESLVQREALLAAVGGSSPSPIYAKDREGRLIYANPAALEVIGLGWEDAAGRTSAEVGDDPVTGRIRMEHDLAVIAGNSTRAFDEIVVRPGGERRLFHVTKSPLRDAGGASFGVVCVAVDVTERERQERQQAFLLDLSDRLRSSTEAAQTATAALGPMLALNRAGFLRVDRTGQLRIARHWAADGAPPLPLDHAAAEFSPGVRAALAAGRTLVIADVMDDPRVADAAPFLKTGTRSAIVVPLLEDGRLVAVLFVADAGPRDWRADEVALVEEVATRCWAAVRQARAERALQRLNAELEARVAAATAERNRLWALTDDLILSAGFDGRVHAVSDSWRRRLGVAADPPAHRALARLLHRDDRRPVRGVLDRLRITGGSVRCETRLRAGDGSWHVIGWTLAAEPGGDRFHGVGRDLTAERAQAAALAATQAQLHEVQKMETIGQLTGGVAHDFNNLLTPIVAGLDAAERRIDDARVMRVVQAGIGAAERARLLVERLLAFSRRQMLLPSVLDVAPLLASLESLLLPLLGASVRVAVVAPAGLPPVLVDANQLELAILNLAVNARDAMPSGGQITITAADVTLPDGAAPAGLAGRFVRLAVSDTGSGMDAATLARAVEPFFTTKLPGQGTGLGLSMVHGLAAQSGGAFRLDSAPGRGTTATLWLPVAK